MLDVRDVEAIVRQVFGGPHVKGFRIREVQFPDSDTLETIRFTGDPLPESVATDAMYLRVEFIDLDNSDYKRVADRVDGSKKEQEGAPCLPSPEVKWRVWVFAPYGGPDDWTIHTPVRVRPAR